MSCSVPPASSNRTPSRVPRRGGGAGSSAALAALSATATAVLLLGLVLVGESQAAAVTSGASDGPRPAVASVATTTSVRVQLVRRSAHVARSYVVLVGRGARATSVHGLVAVVHVDAQTTASAVATVALDADTASARAVVVGRRDATARVVVTRTVRRSLAVRRARAAATRVASLAADRTAAAAANSAAQRAARLALIQRHPSPTATTVAPAPTSPAASPSGSLSTSPTPTTTPVASDTRAPTSAAPTPSTTPATPTPTAPTPTATPPTPTLDTTPSGVPTADLAGWKLAFAEDFTRPAALGSFLSTYASTWTAYSAGWYDTSRNGRYDPAKTLSVSNGNLDIYLHTVNGVHYVSAPEPKLPVMTYGRYSIRFQADQIAGYKTAWLLWPDDDAWPEHGEIDFPEGNLDQNISAFAHWASATGGQDAFSTTRTYATWHTATTEWAPGRITFILDGVVLGTSTRLVPSAPMHWVIQSETQLSGGAPADTAAGHVRIDWAAAWTYAS